MRWGLVVVVAAVGLCGAAAAGAARGGGGGRGGRLQQRQQQGMGLGLGQQGKEEGAVVPVPTLLLGRRRAAVGASEGAAVSLGEVCMYPCVNLCGGL